MTTAARFSIPADHPALAGHFPGRPIVPAVMIMDEVLAAARQQPGWRIAGVRQAKFTAVLLPGEDCIVTFSPGGGGLRFSCSAAGKIVATGLLERPAGGS